MFGFDDIWLNVGRAEVDDDDCLQGGSSKP